MDEETAGGETMNVHQMLRYLKYRKRDAIRACTTYNFDDDVEAFIKKMFDEMMLDVEEMWRYYDTRCYGG